MNFFKQKLGIIILFCSLVALFVVSYVVYRVVASEPTNIKAESKFAWSENGGWFNFGSSDGAVMVEDSALTGYIWSENLGWISLNCSNNNSCATSDYKISNDGEGNLTGYAWGENIGWVNFAPTNGGVRIDSAGEFSGYAWGENTGWIVFNCQDVGACAASDFKVKTTWLPLSARNQAQSEEKETEGLEVSDVNFSSTDNSIAIDWKTNHDADSRVRWGKDKNLEKEKNDDDNVEKHRMVLKDLEPDTQYYFRVKSVDKSDNSDYSRIYSASTKPVSAVFAKRQWEKAPDVLDGGEEYEAIEIEVTDKEEAEEEVAAEKEEVKEGNKEENVENPVQVETPDEVSNGPGFVWRFFSGMKNLAVGFFSGIHDLALGGQRNIAKIFHWADEKMAGAYGSLVAKFNKEKASEIAKINRAKYFTTQVFSRDDKKLLAQVRFQILDRSDNPIPNLQTTLFSDPQTTTTDDDGIATFQDVPIGSHTLAFDYEGEKFRKNVAIADTLTDEGKVRAEIVQVKAQKERIAMWMWAVIMLLIVAVGVAIYFARQYYRLKKNIEK